MAGETPDLAGVQLDLSKSQQAVQSAPPDSSLSDDEKAQLQKAVPAQDLSGVQLDLSKSQEVAQPWGGAAPIDKDDRGVAAGLYRNTIGQVVALHHAFTDPVTDQEKGELYAKYAKEVMFEREHGRANDPASLAALEQLRKSIENPSSATLAWHRLLDAPGDALSKKADKELEAANELWNNKHKWRGLNVALSGGADKVLSAIPILGPMVNSIAERAEQGDISGAVTDVGSILALEHAPQAVKSVFKSNAAKLETAVSAHNAAQKVHTQALRESGVALKEADAAATTAQNAREAEAQGKMSAADRAAAEDAATKATNKARQAQKAVIESGEQRANASMELDRMQRKMERQVRKEQARLQSIKSDQSLEAKGKFQDAIPPTKAAPYDDNDFDTYRRYAEPHHENVEPIRSPEDVSRSAEYERQGIEDQVSSAVQRYKDNHIAGNVKARVVEALGEAEKVKPGTVEAALDVLSQYNLTDPSMVEADAIRKQLNHETRGVLKKNSWDVATALATDPEFAAKYHAANALRDGIYDRLEQLGIKNARELRQDEASLIRIRNAADRQIYNGEKTVRGTGEAGPVRRALGKSSTAIGATAGAALGGAVGGLPGAEIGAGLGGVAGKLLEKKIAPPDFTRSELIEQSFGNKIATGKPGTLEGTPLPSEPQATGWPQGAMLPRDAESVGAPTEQAAHPNERTYLHADLASHYDEFPWETGYEELEQRFRDDIEIKKKHSVPLDGDEKRILKEINKAEADRELQVREKAKKDAEAAQKAQEEQEKDKADKAALGLNTNTAHPFIPGPDLEIPESWDKTAPQIRAHELGHMIMADQAGWLHKDVISHLHDSIDKGMAAEARWDSTPLFDDNGKLDLTKMAQNIEPLLDMFHGGAVAEELVHDLPVEQNAGAKSDLYRAEGWLKQLGFKPAEIGAMMKASELRVRDVFTTPGVKDIVERYTRGREAGLEDDTHMSEKTVAKAIQEVKNILGGGDEGAKQKSNSGQAGRVGKETEAGGKGGIAPADKTETRPAGKTGTVVGRSKRGVKTNVGTAPEIELIEPELAEGGQGGHAGGGVVSAEELNRQGRFVKIGRGGALTDQGKTPDFNLRTGESGYQIKPDGTVELKAGQETPSSKAAAERAVKEFYGKNLRANVTASRLVEKSTGVPEQDEMIKAAGGIPAGTQDYGDAGKIVSFHDPKTEATLGFKPGEAVTREGAEKKIAESRKQFGLETPESHSALVEKVNSKDWFHVTPDAGEKAYAHIGQFFSSSHEGAGVYGQPEESTYHPQIKNPLVGDPEHIAKELGTKDVAESASPKEIVARDREWALAAKKKGYDSIIRLSPEAYFKYVASGEIPEQMELNSLEKLK